MANEIFGPFHSKEDAIKKVSVLELKGLKAENITIFTNKENTAELEDRTDVDVENNAIEDDGKDSFIDKIKKVMLNSQDSSLNIHEKLVQLGVSDKQASMYVDAIESGEILVIADDELKMGNDPTSDTVTLEEEVIHRNS
ncbi:Heat induced stress protein YflT [Virgibacillus subterraneus]|uniref:Heat induced stress protein YflT n=1 Tax=Virgibacillus subterraneus TaxID=621109 RepID=A0A1H9FEX9_9BACI|nr:general stress protein [Virgibacillus subterraneus]SEQ36486.1 Heat induced stress protein YflT [Virgibacillus subterraneus]